MTRRKNFHRLLIFLGTAAMGICLAAVALHANDDEYTFIVAGHVYGSHQGTNVGIYPKFLDHLRGTKSPFSFLVLNGDIVRRSTAESWQTVQKEIDSLKIPAYFVMGNHDDSPFSREFFAQKYGQTYYSFRKGTEAFIVLDEQEVRGSIPPRQIALLKQELERPGTKNVFIFFHELIWTAHRLKYLPVRHNYGSYNRVFRSNFWPEVFPLLSQYRDKMIFVVAGDVGGNPGTAPAFFEQIGHITLLASGMGEVRDENYLAVHVKNGGVRLRLVPLNESHSLKDLTSYTLP